MISFVGGLVLLWCVGFFLLSYLFFAVVWGFFVVVVFCLFLKGGKFL